jgi:hypothetical protein
MFHFIFDLIVQIYGDLTHDDTLHKANDGINICVSIIAGDAFVNRS